MQQETSSGTCTIYVPYDMIEQTRENILPPVHLEVRLAAHEIKLLCIPHSAGNLARDFHIQG